MSEHETMTVLPLRGSVRGPLLFFAALMLVPVLGVLAAIVATCCTPAFAGKPPVPWPVLLLPLALAALTILLWRGLARAGVRVGHGQLIVATGLGSKQVPLSSLRGAGLRIVDLDEHTELKPRWRTWGTSLPGFHAGWFRLRNGEKAVCLLLDRHRVSYLRTNDGLSLLLSLERPDDLRRFVDAAM